MSDGPDYDTMNAERARLRSLGLVTVTLNFPRDYAFRLYRDLGARTNSGDSVLEDLAERIYSALDAVL